jgi:adenosylcobinamide-phosphate synthase
MTPESQIVVAAAVDMMIGDPRWFPHPVKLMGWGALKLERHTRRFLADPTIAGGVTAAVVIVLSVAGAALLTRGVGLLNETAGEVCAVFLIYSGLAARDMITHSRAVFDALEAGSLDEARAAAGKICGRDTGNLDEAGLSKATVESVAENLVDGVTGPLFFAVLAGAEGVIFYKAVSTLDSTFGYKNEQYLEFGRVSAKLDDLLNFVPARLTACLTPLAAAFIGCRAGDAWRILLRDRKNHASPNSGHTEAAFSGALGVRLGGLASYFGQITEKPFIGDPIVPMERLKILQAGTLFLATAALTGAVLLGLRRLLVHAPELWGGTTLLS